MLDNDILQQVKTVFASLNSETGFVLTGDPTSDDTREMREFLNDMVSCSSRLSLEEVEASAGTHASFSIKKNGQPTGISFLGIPNGHEFTSLLLAVLNASGIGKNLPDEALQKRIMALRGPASLRTVASLSCTNCPDVVQALNVVALYNPLISHEFVDGGVAPDIVEKLGVQSVPTVFLGDEMLSVGRASLSDLLAKLEARLGSEPITDFEPAVHDFEAVIAGGGPAGAAAAIYLARKGMNVAVVAGRVGGQVNDTMDIENLISVTKTTGPRLAVDLREHLDDNKVKVFDNRNIVSCDLSQPLKTVSCDSKETFTAPIVIIATGASWRRLNVAGEADYIGRGVAFCTHCDGPFYAGKRVAVVGGGNSGIEAAIDLAAICTHVDVYEFMDSLKADTVLVDKVRSLPNVDIHLSSAVQEVTGNGTKVTGIKVKDRVTGKVTDNTVDGVFVQIGLISNNAPFGEHLQLTRAGEIIVDSHCRTSIPGVYAAGDVTDVPYKQIVIAMGEGAKAALSAFDDRMRGVTPSLS